MNVLVAFLTDLKTKLAVFYITSESEGIEFNPSPGLLLDLAFTILLVVNS